jgi:hypothetical protein
MPRPGGACEAQDQHKVTQAVHGQTSQNPWSGAGSNRRPSAFQRPCRGPGGFCLVKLGSPVTCITARQGHYNSILAACRRVPGSAGASVLSACWTPPEPRLVLTLCWRPGRPRSQAAVAAGNGPFGHRLRHQPHWRRPTRRSDWTPWPGLGRPAGLTATGARPPLPTCRHPESPSSPVTQGHRPGNLVQPSRACRIRAVTMTGLRPCAGALIICI